MDRFSDFKLGTASYYSGKGLAWLGRPQDCNAFAIATFSSIIM